MIAFSKIYRLAFQCIVILCFLIGGVTQFFLGIPNTLYTYLISIFFILFYITHAFWNQKIIWDKVVGSLFLFAMTMIISAIFNGTSLLKLAIYLLFFLLPFGCYIFFKLNQKNKYISHVFISKLYLLIALIQLPVVLFQRFSYDFLIDFNMSNQAIASIDFMFGTFFIKADHAMGFFLLMNIFNILENNEHQKLTKYPKFIFTYLGATILISESNVSKVLFLGLALYLLYKSFPRKIRVISFVIAIFFIPIIANQALKIEAVKTEAYFLSTQYNVSKSWTNYEKGIAKRPQVIIAYATKVPIKIIGDGPYSYYDILKSEFTKTKHFSQILWTYADLGLIGILVFFLVVYRLVMSLNISKTFTIFVFFIIAVYALMTTIFLDLAIMITLISLLQKTNE